MANDQPVLVGAAALDAGDWQRARDAFAEALAVEASAVALDGMGRALWWLGDLDQAVTHRARAFNGFRNQGDVTRAARIAFWLAREYATVLGNPAAANGWFARGMRLVEESPPGPARGWLDLARVQRTVDPLVQERYAESAYRHAREYGDPDLEIYALAARGLARINRGYVETGMTDLDAALATAVDASNLDAVGDTLCTLMLAAEVVGDPDRFAQWNQVLEQYMAKHSHVSLTGFCFTCCGEVFAINGQWEEADRWLRRALAALERTGHRSRCAHPAARLARLRIRQGKLEEAEAILAEFPGIAETAESWAALALARNRPTTAIEVAERRLAHSGDGTLPAVPLLSILVQAQLAVGSIEGAHRASKRLKELADRSGLDRVHGLSALASARVARFEGRDADARTHLLTALDAFDRAGMPLERAIVRRELAQVAFDTNQRDVAADEAGAALREFRRLGAQPDADETAAFLNNLGVRIGGGSRGIGTLTHREREVLELLAAGLTNAEIADRLYISVKTAGNHVSNVLTKLGARTRTEAAVLALHEAGENS